MARDRQSQAPLLYASHTNYRTALALNHHRIGPKAAVTTNRREVVDMDYMVDFRLVWYRHCQAAILTSFAFARRFRGNGWRNFRCHPVHAPRSEERRAG